jgi:site-specific recombinase XerC
MDPQQLLATLPRGHPDWRRVLAALISLNVHHHATKQKGVSNDTLQRRPVRLFALFRDLHDHTPYRCLDPRSLGNRHVAALVQLWTERGLSAGTIANYLSDLRVLARWIGKSPSIVRSAEDYVGAGSPLAHRRQAADHDHSWIAQAVAFEGVRRQLQERCEYVALQTEFSRLFGCRPKEARCLRPHEAVIARAQARPADIPPCCTAAEFLHLAQGTKGGRPRDVPIESDAQRELLVRARALVPPGAHLGRPGKTLRANTAHYYRVLREVGITRAQRGVTAHGLRHEYANDRYEALTGQPSTVRGGHGGDGDLDRQGRLAVSRSLGHNRPQVSSCYLGSSAVMRRKTSKEATPGEEAKAANSK